MGTQGLNPEQAKAVEHNHGPLLILAGAGSGKTTVLVARTGRLIAERVARPEDICVLTFTNKAARELKHRVGQKLGAGATAPGRGIWAGTFHSFGLQILRQNHKEAGLPAYFGILDQSDSAAVLKELLKDLTVAGKDKFDIEKILEIMNGLRVRQSQGRRSKLEAFDEYHEVAEALLPKYLKKLDLLGSVDFEGLLLKPLELFKSHPDMLQKIQNRFSQMMVDEFQDTNETQMKLINEIVKQHRNITVVGDDDQSIYGWRGAQVANILDFPKIYAPCEVIKLERNYRSTPAILGLANELISKNRRRHGKVLTAEGSKGIGETPELFVIDNDDEEAEFAAREIQNFLQLGYKHQDIAILYRSNSQGGMIESVLRKNRVPYTVSGGTGFFDRKEVKDILAYLRYALNANDVGLRRIINTPPRGIGDTTIERINEHAIKNKTSFVRAAHDWRRAGAPEKSGLALEQLFEFLKSLPSKIMAGAEATPGLRLLELFRGLGYRDYLYTTTKEPHAAEKKWLFLEIFGRVLDSFVAKGGATEKTLREFVDAMELRDDGSDGEEGRDKVSLMTLHACKGLEFPCVLIVGVEEDLIPHKTLGTDVDEERRLFYVGLTRAKERLVLSRCKLRKRHGQLRPVTPSRFLLELPASGIKAHATEFRPVTSTQRENLLTDFLSNLDKKIETSPSRSKKK
jgi:DNA helicase-2/ATP-dependent DNA helicase PcrA